MYEEDFEHMKIILSDNTIGGIEKRQYYLYWQKRVIRRIEYLQPLIKECEEKKIDLKTLSKELAQEWIDLHDAVELFNFKRT